MSGEKVKTTRAAAESGAAGATGATATAADAAGPGGAFMPGSCAEAAPVSRPGSGRQGKTLGPASSATSNIAASRDITARTIQWDDIRPAESTADLVGALAIVLSPARMEHTRRTGLAPHATLLVLTAAAVLLRPGAATAQQQHYPLESAAGLTLHNVAAEPATLQDKKGLRLTLAEETRRQLETMTAQDPQRLSLEQYASIDGLEFSNGNIEVELAGVPAPGAGEGARGFVGIAFRLQKEKEAFDAFYLRPTNGRAGDQERRNHSAQYVANPDWPWFRLRKETPGRYESYVDLVPGQWTKIRIEVRGERARLYVRGSEQPTLIVNDVKSGAQGKGAVALWIGPGAVAHSRNLAAERLP